MADVALGTDLDDRHTLLSAIYDSTAADVYGFLLVRCGDPTIAADVMSDVYLAAAQAVGGDRPQQVTRSWLLTAARRRLIDHWRRQSTRSRTINALVFNRSPESGTDSPIDLDRVAAALASLPPNQRFALTLRYLDDHSVAEVSEAMDLSYQAAESLLARARRSFRAAWEGGGTSDG